MKKLTTFAALVLSSASTFALADVTCQAHDQATDALVAKLVIHPNQVTPGDFNFPPYTKNEKVAATTELKLQGQTQTFESVYEEFGGSTRFGWQVSLSGDLDHVAKVYINTRHYSPTFQVREHTLGSITLSPGTANAKVYPMTCSALEL